jgi:K+ potassium transporter
VLPAAAAILLALFAAFGTAAIGRGFGPIMPAWFAIIVALGVYGILQHLEVFIAIDPRYGLDYLSRDWTLRQGRKGQSIDAALTAGAIAATMKTALCSGIVMQSRCVRGGRHDVVAAGSRGGPEFGWRVGNSGQSSRLSLFSAKP